MKVLVTGASGFIGRHVVSELLSVGHEVTAMARDLGRAKDVKWYHHVRFVSCDLLDSTLQPALLLGVPDALIHLAWTGLPNYQELFHFEINLPAHYQFIKTMIAAGTKHILVTGTCLEYGMQSGPLSEDLISAPVTPYGLAKDTLRKFIQALQNEEDFTVQWVRLFYMYGPGQNPNSLIAQLDKAIDNGERIFNMSGGEQLRDYLPVEEAAKRLAKLVEHPEFSGIINCCSGKPVSVRSLVEQRIAKRGANILLNLGYYSYPEYEPMAFWGNPHKLNNFLQEV